MRGNPIDGAAQAKAIDLRPLCGESAELMKVKVRGPLPSFREIPQRALLTETGCESRGIAATIGPDGLALKSCPTGSW
jgi:hypothetical protein